MAKIQYGLRELQFIADDGHGWLEVPTADVEASGDKPSKYSYHEQRLGKDWTYLEEDADISGFMVATGVDPADVVDVINHVSNYIRLTGSCWVNTLDHCSGEGFVSRFPMMFREAN